MCHSRNSTKIYVGEKIPKVDKCLANLLMFINGNTSFRTLGSCCGHGKYPMTIVASWNGMFNFDIISGVTIPRKKRFYLKDVEGYYYIPETLPTHKTKSSTCEKCFRRYETYPIILDNNPLSIVSFYEEEMKPDGTMRHICQECREKESKNG